MPSQKRRATTRRMLFLAQLLDFASTVVFVAVIISWLGLPPDNPIVKLTDTLVEPLLAPIRQILPPTGGLDFSPMVLLVGLQILKRVVIQL